jgi:hypothetical protein
MAHMQAAAAQQLPMAQPSFAGQGGVEKGGWPVLVVGQGKERGGALVLTALLGTRSFLTYGRKDTEDGTKRQCVDHVATASAVLCSLGLPASCSAGLSA